MSVRIPANIFWRQSQETESHDDLHGEHARWFALRVGPRREKLVARLFKREGVECYLPLRERPFKYKSKSGVRQLPLLPGYLFVRIVREEALTVLRTQYVHGFLTIGKERRCVAQAEIDLLRRLSSDDSLVWSVEDKADLLAEGTPVEICRGGLAGVRGHYLYQKSKKIFVISFGGVDARLTSCEVAPEDVIPVGDSPQATVGDRVPAGKTIHW